MLISPKKLKKLTKDQIQEIREHALGSATEKIFYTIRLPAPKFCGKCHVVHTHSKIVSMYDSEGNLYFHCPCGSTLLSKKAA